MALTRRRADRLLMQCWTALTIGDYAVFQKLLEDTSPELLKEAFHHTEKGDTLLTAATRRGDQRAVQMLLAAGADPASPNGIGSVALHVASNLDHPECIDLLLAAHADINTEWVEGSGMSALHFACRQGAEASLRRLMRAKDTHSLELDARSSRSLTPLHMVASKGHAECARILLANHADVNLPGPSGMSALHFCAYKGHGETAMVLCEAGAHIDALCSKSPLVRTPLHICCERGHLEASQVLSSYGAARDFFHDAEDGDTAERVAARHAHHELLTWLRCSRHFCRAAWS